MGSGTSRPSSAATEISQQSQNQQKSQRSIRVARKPEKERVASRSYVKIKESLLDDHQLKQILSGDPTYETQSQSRVVRIFTSSTFTDTKNERNNLMEKAYPTMKEFCQQLGYEFQVVDMRWGVREDAENDHMQTELCLKEIKLCQELSTGPNFVTFLSHKYGYRPFPRTIEADEFEMITHGLSEEQHSLVHKWFLRDDNALPVVYVLQPISSFFPGFLSKNQDEQKRAKNDWWEVYLQLQEIIHEGAKRRLDKDRAHYYSMSVTERELANGILTASAPNKHCIWFKRTFNDIDNLKSSKLLSRFHECQGSDEQIEESNRLLDSLRGDRLLRALPSDNIMEYNLDWDEDGGVNPDNADHNEYLKKLCVDFETSLKDLIHKGIVERQEVEVSRDPILTEILQHAEFCRNKAKLFHGREDLVDAVGQYLCSNSNLPLVLYGDSGCGKTALMAVAATEAWDWMKAKGVVVFRFIGTSQSSSSIRPLLSSLNRHLSMVFWPQMPKNHWDPRSEMKTLSDGFSTLLSKASASKPLCVILDSLDQLEVMDGGRQLDWLPKVLPPHVKLLLSTLPQESYGCLPRCKSLFPKESCYIGVKELNQTDIQGILSKWLSVNHRTITEDQHKVFMQAIKQCPLPLHALLCFEKAKRWHSYNPLSQTQLEATIEMAISGLFERIEREHGEILVTHALAMLTAARRGLTEGEMEDLLSLCDPVLNDVYQYWTPPVRRLPPLLWVRIKYELGEFLVTRGADNAQVICWYHRQFLETAEARYLSNKDLHRLIHSALAEYFLGTYSEVSKPFIDRKGKTSTAMRYVAKQPLAFDRGNFNLRKLNQMPFHITQTGDVKAFKTHVGCNFEFLQAKIAALGASAILQDLKEAQMAFPKDQELSVVMETLQLSQNALATDPLELAGQLIGRIHIGQAANKTVVDQAREALDAGQFDLETATMVASLTDMLEQMMGNQEKEKSHLVELLTGARNSSRSCLVPHSGCLMPPGGQLLHKLSPHWQKVNDIDLSPDGRLVASASDDNTVKICIVETGELALSITLLWDVVFVRFFHDNRHLVASTLMNHFYLVDCKSGSVVREIKCPQGSDTKPIVTCRTHDDRDILAIMIANKIQVIDPRSGKEINSIPDGLNPAMSRKFNEKKHFATLNHYLVYACYLGNTVGVLPLANATDTAVVSIPVFSEQINESETKEKPHIAAMTTLEHKGTPIVAVCDGFTQAFFFYNLETCELLVTTPGKTNESVIQASYSPINNYVYYASIDNVGIVNIAEGKRSQHFKHPCHVKKVVGLDGRHVVTLGEDSVLRIWDQTLSPFSPDVSSFTGKVTVKSDSNMAMFQEMLDMLSNTFDIEDNKMQTDLLTKEDVSDYWTESAVLNKGVNFSTQFHPFPHSRYSVVSQTGEDVTGDKWTQCLTLWDLVTMQCVRRSFPPGRALRLAAVTRTGDMVLQQIGNGPSTPFVKLSMEDWQLNLMDDEDNLPLKGKEIAYSRDLHCLVSQSGDRYISIYNGNTGACCRTMGISESIYKSTASTCNDPAMLSFTQYCIASDGTVITLWANSHLCIGKESEDLLTAVNLKSYFKHLTPFSREHSVRVQYLSQGNLVLIYCQHVKERNPKAQRHMTTEDVMLYNLSNGEMKHSKPMYISKPTSTSIDQCVVLRCHANQSVLQRLNFDSNLNVYASDEQELKLITDHLVSSEDGQFHVTWCSTEKDNTLAYWSVHDDSYSLSKLGSFSSDEKVDEITLVDGGHGVLINSCTGLVQLTLSGGSSAKRIPSYKNLPPLFDDKDLNVQII